MLYLYAPRDSDELEPLLRQALPEIELVVWPQKVDTNTVRYVLVWNPPEGFFTQFPRLEAIFALGAGVDRLVGRSDLPDQVSIIRLADAGMAQQMAEYALYGVLRYQRHFDRYQQQQAERRWQPQPPRLAHEVRISVLGLGAIGSVVAKTLAGLGYAVSGWSRQPRQLQGVKSFYGPGALDVLLAETDVLVSILPSTPETRGLLNREHLKHLPHGAALINAGRGDQLDLEAVLHCLETGQLRFAQLDVFPEEPLPFKHPLWARQDVIITPHVAAITLSGPAVNQVAANLRALQRGEKPSGLVERQRAY